MLDIQVQRMYRFETDRPLKAFVDIVVNNVLLIKGVRVMDGKNGLFVSMPREQAKDQKWYDSVRCLTEEVRNQINTVVMDTYNEDLDEDLDEAPRVGASPEELEEHIVPPDEDVIINN